MSLTLKLDAPVRHLYIVTGYFSDEYMRARQQTTPVLDSRMYVADPMTGRRVGEDEIRRQFDEAGG